MIVDAGHRVLTGGLGGVMSAAMRGARSSRAYKEGDTIALLPDNYPTHVSPYADITLCTGLGEHRNGLVGRADGVIAIGGGAGTLQEVAVAWANRRPVVVLMGVSGVTAGLAGQHIDGRGPVDRQPVMGAASAVEAVELLLAAVQAAGRTHESYPDQGSQARATVSVNMPPTYCQHCS